MAPVDEVSITTLVDNSYDGLLLSDSEVVRAGFAAGVGPAGQFLDGTALLGMRAEHGFSTLIQVRRGDSSSTIVFDTAMAPDTMLVNADRLGVDWAEVQAVVLSHGHFDHCGGLEGLARGRGPRRTPLIVHPRAWTRRRFVMPGSELTFPTLSPAALEAEGFDIIERREPSLLLNGSLLVTGEVDRTTDFEHGMPPPHEAWEGAGWEHDPLVLDDQAVVIDVRGRGLVVITGCGHAGVVNIVRHAMRLTGVNRLHALIGGFHLGGPAFEPIIPATVDALAQWEPKVLVPGHCTGWRAQHALAARLPDAWMPGASGSRYIMAAA
ncbi:MAG TPA: MBL fold metallo-hydrolase [Dermatophilaceae bacterium]|nr:MBL fold metallo-hydrolase [Dermatophilaceae bacterium]